MSRNKRLHHIDAVKALAILCMVQVHTASLVSPVGVSITHPLALLSAVIGGMAAPLFVTLSGWGVHRAVKKRLSTRDLGRWLISRITLLVAMQLLVNLLLPQSFRWFTPGVLTLLALCTLLTPLSAKFFDKRAPLLIFSLLVALSSLLPLDFGVSWSWDELVYSSGGTEWLAHLFLNGTYPLLPWWSFFLAGGLLQDDNGGSDLRISGCTALSLLAVTGGFALISGSQWALTSGAAVLTFFPANLWFVLTAATWSHFIWYSACHMRQRAERLFAILAPAGALSLSIYVIHFSILRLIVEYRPESLSIEVSFVMTLIHTAIWIPLAFFHQKYIPNFSLESISHILVSFGQGDDERTNAEQE